MRRKKFRTGGNNKGRRAWVTLSGGKAINSYLKRETFAEKMIAYVEQYTSCEKIARGEFD